MMKAPHQCSLPPFPPGSCRQGFSSGWRPNSRRPTFSRPTFSRHLRRSRPQPQIYSRQTCSHRRRFRIRRRFPPPSSSPSRRRHNSHLPASFWPPFSRRLELSTLWKFADSVRFKFWTYCKMKLILLFTQFVSFHKSWALLVLGGGGSSL